MYHLFLSSIPKESEDKNYLNKGQEQILSFLMIFSKKNKKTNKRASFILFLINSR